MIEMHSKYDNMHENGIFYAVICINNHVFACEDCMSSVPTDTRWVDSNATIHVSVSIQGYLHFWKPRSEEKYVYSRNDTSDTVEGIITFRLLLNMGHFVNLLDTFVVPSFRCNQVFVSTLDKFGYMIRC